MNLAVSQVPTSITALVIQEAITMQEAITLQEAMASTVIMREVPFSSLNFFYIFVYM